MSDMNKCVFFDRDGIVNQAPPHPGYIERWSDFHLIPEFVDVAKFVIERGYLIAIATNQRAVSRKIMTQEVLDEIHDNLICLLKKEHGIEFLDIYCCTHERDSCGCRKPRPGMLLQAADDHGIDLSLSWMIGDNETDVNAGIRAGCKTILVCDEPAETEADITVDNMRELKDLASTLF